MGVETRFSPRTRRRLLWLGAVAAVGGVVGLVFALLPESKGGFNTPRSKGKVQVVRQERQVPLTARTRKEINALLDRFVPAAVERRDPEAAYDLVTPTLKAVAPRRLWKTGEIPVSPFDTRGTEFHGWTVVTSYRNALTIDLTLPPRNPKDGPAAFTVDLKRIDGRWRVDEFYRRTGYAPAPSAAPKPKPATTAVGQRKTTASKGRIGAIWLLVPLGLLSLIVIVPAFLFLRGWLEDKRVKRRYRREMSSELPPLPGTQRREQTPGGGV